MEIQGQKIKTGAVEGSVEWYKAHLVAQGYSKKYGTNNDETFCQVVSIWHSLARLVASVIELVS